MLANVNLRKVMFYLWKMEVFSGVGELVGGMLASFCGRDALGRTHSNKLIFVDMQRSCDDF